MGWQLRAFGVPLETVANEDGEVAGYQIRGKDFYLPYLYLAAGEHASGAQPRRPNRYGYQSLRQLTFEPDELELVAQLSRNPRGGCARQRGEGAVTGLRNPRHLPAA